MYYFSFLFCVFFYIVFVFCVLFVRLSFSVLCTQCCQCLWIVHTWFPIRFSLTFIYSNFMRSTLHEISICEVRAQFKLDTRRQCSNSYNVGIIIALKQKLITGQISQDQNNHFIIESNGLEVYKYAHRESEPMIYHIGDKHCSFWFIPLPIRLSCNE